MDTIMNPRSVLVAVPLGLLFWAVVILAFCV